MIVQSKENLTFTQADGAVEILPPNNWSLEGHQISFGGDATSGTLAFEVKYHKEANFEVLYLADGTTPKVVDLANIQSFVAEGVVYSFKVTPTAVDAGYKVLIISGVEDENE